MAGMKPEKTKRTIDANSFLPILSGPHASSVIGIVATDLQWVIRSSTGTLSSLASPRAMTATLPLLERKLDDIRAELRLKLLENGLDPICWESEFPFEQVAITGLESGPYWAERGLNWITAGLHIDAKQTLVRILHSISTDKQYPQKLRHRALTVSRRIHLQ